jgi:molecular chaperone GrpE
MSDAPASSLHDDGDDERGSEVDDYTGETPRVDSTAPHDAGVAGAVPSGFGDGDVADIEDSFASVEAEFAAELTPALFEELTAERDQYRDLAMRTQADFENFRKRSAAQAETDIHRATGRLAEALLPVLDAAEAAYVQHPDEVEPLLNVLLSELKKHGLETLDIAGEPFDPEVADAVAHEPGSGGEVVVAEVLRSGYRWRGKTLRPAMVRTRD